MKYREIKNLFWDTDLKTLDINKHADQIIERVLDIGGVTSYKWLRKTYSTEKIHEALLSSRRIRPKSAIFWCHIFNINFKKTKCFQIRSQKMVGNFWPY